MKNILVPTDFSLYAEMALEAAMTIANNLTCKIVIFHKADLPLEWENQTTTDQKADRNNYTKYSLIKAKLDQIVEAGKDRGVDIHAFFSTGGLIKNMKKIIQDESIDLVVMGSHGASGKEEFFIGSNAQKVVRKLHVPTLVVKSPINKQKFSKVLFASGLNKEERESFRHFLHFIRPFNPDEIHLMAVDTTDYFKQPTPIMKEALKSFEKMAADMNCSTHFHRDYSIEAGIRHLGEELGVDLIALSNKHRRPVKRAFQGSNVEMLVNHSNIPVLALD